MTTGRVRPADVIGVPMMPPGGAAVAGTRVRGALGRLYRGMAPAPVRVLEGLWGLLDHAALVALCELGVPEALDRASGGATATELAGHVGADPDALDRLLR